MDLPRVVLITGTRKGIGRFLAEHFVRKGDLVEGCSRHAPEWNLENYTHHVLDVADEARVRDMFSSVARRHGRLDILLNNAGIASMNHALLTPSRTAVQVVETNFIGTFLTCREAARLMRRQRFGRIVNFSTIAVPMRIEGEAIYVASKSAVQSFTQVLARELGSYGITCNVIAPAPIETDLIRGVPREKIDAIVGRLAIKRLGRNEDVANVIDFYVSPASDYVTGQTIYLGGAG